jgi:hypothetical protein
MLAAGRGFVNPSLDNAKALAAFLDQRSPSFQLNVLPAQIPSTTPTFFQNRSMYLLYTTAFIWKVFGISWTTIFILNSALFGLTAAIAYGLFRLAVSRPFAIAGSLVYVLSGTHLGYLPHLRDYSKAPFFMAVLLICGYLALRARSRATVYALSTFAGVLLGLGYGFRTDLLILIPLFFALAWFFAPVGVKSTLIIVLPATALLMGGFMVAAMPVLRATSADGTNSFHVSVLGFATIWNAKLELDDPAYEVSHLYDDSYIATSVNSFARRIHNTTTTVYSREYDAMCLRYFVEVAKALPGDIVTRFYASIVRISNLLFVSYDERPAVRNASITLLYKWVGALLHPERGVGIYIIVICLIGLSIAGLRTVLWVLIVVGYTCGYPFVQFQERQYFHLGFISVFAVLMSAQWLAGAMRSATGNPRSLSLAAVAFARSRKRDLERTAWLAVAIAVTMSGSMYGARIYQDAHVRFVIGNILGDLTPVPTTVTALSQTEVLVGSPEWAARTPEEASDWSTDYLVVQFAGMKRLDASVDVRVPVSYVYDTSAPSLRDFSKHQEVNIAGGLRYLFQPIYYGRLNFFHSWDVSAAFRGIAIPKDLVPYLKGVYKLRHQDRIPVLLSMVLPLDWEEIGLHQVFRDPEAIVTGRRSVYSYPGGLMFENAQLAEMLKADDQTTVAGTIVFTAPTVVTVRAGKVTVDDAPHGADPTVLKLADLQVRTTRYLVLKGEISEGGFQLGVIKDGKWYVQMFVRKRGDFAVVIEMRGPGLFSTVIYSSPSSAGQDRFRLDYVGWRE